MFDSFIENYKQEMINSLSDLIRFESISCETNNPDCPFGEECKKALEYTLNLAKSWGFRTKNLDGYCGYVEFGEGAEMLGIIGHLDVVPANFEDGWTSNPFEATIRNNKIYGRGSIDDKGPVIASLYAMKAVFEAGKKLNKRVRLILGLNEEKAWKCINHYKEIGEDTPNIGFSPDADFPTIYAEKGILSIRIYIPFPLKNMKILNIDCNNNALNVVPKYCSITMQDNDSGKISKLEFEGIASHAAHPDLGENAITKLLKYLNDNFECKILQNLFELGIFDITSPKFLSENVIQDESGILTSNVGFIDYKNDNLEIGLNLRVPVNTSLSSIKEKYKSLENMEVKFSAEQAPLYIPKDSYLIQTLTKIFNEKTGQNAKPIAIGGGTYARAFPNCVAFGSNMPGDKDMCHQVDEFIGVDNLITSSKIYANAIYELAK